MTGSKLLLINAGKSDWKIVIGSEASPSEIYAGEELQHFLHEISGVWIPISDDGGELSPHEILVGSSRHLDRLKSDIDSDGLGEEGFVIQTAENHLIIAGGRKRGTLYGVYTFLEDYLGCRWFSSKVSHIPQRSNIEIPAIKVKQVPTLEYREVFYSDAFDGDWAARNKVNGQSQHLEARHGGKIKYSHFVHTFNSLVPVEKYFDIHPEYFSEVGGKRISENTQLCLTNPDVLRISIETVKQWIRENPDATIFSVSQNDWYNPCQCDKCRSIDEREGSHSGTLLYFVNRIAEEIEKEFPDKCIDTLAYQYTRKPPKHIRPRENVIVRLCSIECCFSHTLEHCREISYPFKDRTDKESFFAEDIMEWSKICQRLYVWDYVTNFGYYLIPFPNLKVLQPNIRFLVKNNAKGIFEEGNYAEGGGGEFAELRAYLLAKLLWNPDGDFESLMSEFLSGYYGKSASPIREYIELLHNKVEKENIHMGIFDPPTMSYLSKEIIDNACSLFDQAEALADDGEVLKRVRIARLPITFVQLTTMNQDHPYKKELIEEFFARVKEAGITRIKEHKPLEYAREQMEKGIISAW